MKLKQGVPVTFDIAYDITQDGKIPADISAAKFFLALYPGEADDKWLIKTYGSGLTYTAGIWTVTVDQSDLDAAAATAKWFVPVLGIQYAGDADYREPDLLESGQPMRVFVEQKYSGV